jgi:hypothetical protein
MRFCDLPELNHQLKVLAMSKSSRSSKADNDTNNKTRKILNNSSSVPSTGEVTKGFKEPKQDVLDAAEEGRLTIRSPDLSTGLVEKMGQRFGATKVVNTIAECMAATKTIIVKGSPMEVPDFKLRLDSAKLVLQYQVGNPVTRSEVVTHNVDTMQTLEGKMQKSPALRRAIGKMLDRSDDNIVDVDDITSDKEVVEAEEALQSIPEQEETEIEAEVRVKVDSPDIKTRTQLSAEEKYNR